MSMDRSRSPRLKTRHAEVAASEPVQDVPPTDALTFPLVLEVVHALSGEGVCRLRAESSWSVSAAKRQIAQLLGQESPSRGSDKHLLLHSTLLGEDEVLEALCSSADGPSQESLPVLKLAMVEVSDEFYVRYFARMALGRDTEFHEFEFCQDGRFRFARNFLQHGFFRGKQLRKECSLSLASLRVLKKLVLESGMLDTTDDDLPLATRWSRQELEIRHQGRHISFATSLPPSFSHIDAGHTAGQVRSMSHFDVLADDIKTFGKTILDIYGVKLQ
mmetsp:Transcript_37578/g.70060  ORF Transcript_37578/g.70060 Transcript_37578/m.70060 type:complete len:274 (-) Transcript_37578:145-966(-)